jgi:hypothetical protein
VIPPLPGEPREGFRPFRAFLDFIRPSGRLTSPQTRHLPLSGGRCTRPVCSSEHAGTGARRLTGDSSESPRWIAPVRSPQGGRSGRHARSVYGAERSSLHIPAFIFGFLAACGASLDGSRGRFGRAEGPRRGTKPREGRDAARSATIAVVIRTRRRSNAPKSTLRAGGIPRCSSATVDASGSGPRDSERQGGNGHGDVVRLPARIPSRGVKRAARTACPPPTAIGSPMSGSGTG